MEVQTGGEKCATEKVRCRIDKPATKTQTHQNSQKRIREISCLGVLVANQDFILRESPYAIIVYPAILNETLKRSTLG